MAGIRIEGGCVLDVEHNTRTVRDVLVRDGRIVEDANDTPPPGEAPDQVVDARDCYVAPGFVDLHTHVFSHGLFRHGRLPADRIGVSQGVACVVDAGSSGAATIDAFPENVLETQATRVFAFINIGSPGLPNLGGGHASRPELCDLAGTVEAFERHPDWLVGVKVLASQSHTGSFGEQAVKLAVKAAELVDKPLMLHIGNAPPVVDTVLDMLRPGDIVTHTYHGKVGGVLGHGGKVIPAFKDAVDRGVIVDLGHGRSSFCFRVFEAAMDQGLPLHSISSDLHRGNVDRYAVSLARTMTKMRMLGWNLMDTVRAATLAPASAIGIDAQGFGSLETGNSAYVTVFREVNEPLEIEDAEGDKRTAASYLETLGVVVGNRYHSRTAEL